MTLDLLVIQPTPFCNINCDYCYLPSRRDSSRMSTETLDIAMQRVFASGLVGTDLSVVWHAGEPPVLPVDYYRQAFSIIERYCSGDVYLRHSIQTNGILLTDKWCDFIREKQVNIGLSIDGPQWIHDVHRRTRNGKGTHTATMKGFELLHKHDIPFHVICVLTKDSLPYPDEIFDFFVGCRVRQLGFNIEEIEGVHKTGQARNLHCGNNTLERNSLFNAAL